ncbi:hypothetical protein LV716_08495 [Flagellimonas sp. HMM57]|uniref:hypothetical protein n=1 Tax=unclassified Flagellimonas TaxID=2644544 RepID=UPI0013D84687|nr:MULTISPECIES: hypothetical protein [unclassified Flagellimonas]UII77794.1 hypothetical protein LV716_08495 [Flagellimonas sp. HMM57]
MKKDIFFFFFRNYFIPKTIMQSFYMAMHQMLQRIDFVKDENRLFPLVHMPGD